jgi:molybdopterin synthase catalytic subunit
MIDVQVQTERFDSGAALDALAQTGAGAVASFIGIVRADGDIAYPDRRVTALELEQYPAMTEAALRSISEAATERFSLTGAIIIHRIGRLEAGEPIVLAAAAAPHRADALDACAYLIDRLKTGAPFWKKQHFADGSAKWVEAKDSDDARAAGWE